MIAFLVLVVNPGNLAWLTKRCEKIVGILKGGI